MNTAYYQKIANGNKRKQTIHSLSVGDEVIEGTDNLLSHATDFYKNLFGPAPGNMLAMDPIIWEPCEILGDRERSILDSPFTVEEVKKALFAMKINRAPGIDNILAEFYQVCWDVVYG